VTGVLARLERLPVVGSTNDVVGDWLAAGVPEVCVAVADFQLAGRGRNGRAWIAPADAALLLSAGFRPAWIAAERAWQIAATLSLAIAEASEEVAGLAAGSVRLKWPNDLVAEAADALPRKLGGVLAEASGLGQDDPRLVVGLGVNADWEASRFPAELAAAMTSLRAIAGRPVARDDLLAAFLARAEARLVDLRAGRFARDEWAARQVLPGTMVRLEGSGGTDGEWLVLAVDGESGALVVADPVAPGGERRAVSGEAVRVRWAARPGEDRPPAHPAPVVSGA
jgi:biotin-[acetyl-CoA-carboxylase] ligase BirA-like protein